VLHVVLVAVLAVPFRQILLFVLCQLFHRRHIELPDIVVHVCEHCAYRTSDKSSLTRHLRLHTGDKPFVCNRCACTVLINTSKPC
jgi:uncharacterized Zn-finger protein